MFKCVCGYQYEYKWKGTEGITIRGDEPFFGIGVVHETYGGEHDILVYDSKNNKRCGELIACPKCGTIKIIQSNNIETTETQKHE